MTENRSVVVWVEELGETDLEGAQGDFGGNGKLYIWIVTAVICVYNFTKFIEKYT